MVQFNEDLMLSHPTFYTEFFALKGMSLPITDRSLCCKTFDVLIGTEFIDGFITGLDAGK